MTDSRRQADVISPLLHPTSLSKAGHAISRRTLLAFGALLPFAKTARSDGSDFPVRSVRLVVPYQAGGGPDIMARTVGQRLSELWKQPVIVDNKPGANSIIGTGEVARAKPDGYTVLVNITLMVQNPSLRSNLPFDTFRDFIPVVRLTSEPLYLTVAKSLGVSNLDEFFKVARERKLAFGSYGTGSTAHLLLVALQNSAKLDITHVPYKGTAPVVQGLMTGEIDCGLLPYTTAEPALSSGTVTVIAVTGAARSPVLPQVPTLQELGMSGFTRPSWAGMFLPSGTPKEIVEKVAHDVNVALATPAVNARFKTLGIEPAGGTPEAFVQQMKDDYVYYKALIEQANVKMD